MERKKKEHTEHSPFSIPRYNLSLSTCTPNMKFLSQTVYDKSLTKNYRNECMERKKSEHIQGRTNWRRWVLYYAIQIVIVHCPFDLYHADKVNLKFSGIRTLVHNIHDNCAILPKKTKHHHSVHIAGTQNRSSRLYQRGSRYSPIYIH